MGRMESAPSSNDPPAAADRLIDSAILPGRSASRTWRFIMMLSPGSMAESFDQSHRHPIYLLLQTFPFHLLRPATLSHFFPIPIYDCVNGQNNFLQRNHENENLAFQHEQNV